MAVINSQNGKPFIDVFDVESNDTTAVDIHTYPKGTVITFISLTIQESGVGTANASVGDDDDADGFLTAADAFASEGTVYGDAVNERGVYLYSSTYGAGYMKYYISAEKTLKLVLSAAVDTQPVFRVIVKGFSFSPD